MTTRPVRRSLAESFRPAAPQLDRGAALAGLLPPKPPIEAFGSPAVEPLTIVREPAPGETRGSGLPDAQPSEGQARLEQPAPIDPGRVRNVAVYLPPELLERFRQTSRSREMTYADLLVEAAAAHLAGLRFQSPASVVVGAGMPARKTRGQPHPGVQVQIRLDGHQVNWLDEQGSALGAPSRTALVVALLRAHLGAAEASIDPNGPGRSH